MLQNKNTLGKWFNADIILEIIFPVVGESNVPYLPRWMLCRADPSLNDSQNPQILEVKFLVYNTGGLNVIRCLSYLSSSVAVMTCNRVSGTPEFFELAVVVLPKE